MTTYIYPDDDSLENDPYLVRYRGTLAEAGRAIQEAGRAGPWDPQFYPGVVRCLLRDCGCNGDPRELAPNDRNVPDCGPYWMIYPLGDGVYLGLGAGDARFLEWDREEFNKLTLTEASCERRACLITRLATHGEIERGDGR